MEWSEGLAEFIAASPESCLPNDGNAVTVSWHHLLSRRPKSARPCAPRPVQPPPRRVGRTGRKIGRRRTGHTLHSRSREPGWSGDTPGYVARRAPTSPANLSASTMRKAPPMIGRGL